MKPSKNRLSHMGASAIWLALSLLIVIFAIMYGVFYSDVDTGLAYLVVAVLLAFLYISYSKREQLHKEIVNRLWHRNTSQENSGEHN